MPLPYTIGGDIDSVSLNQNFSYLDSEKLGIGDLPHVNVRDYGAVGDYVPSTDTGTNDTAAIQAAIDDALSYPQCKIVFDSKKRYLADQVNIDGANNIVIEGNGSELHLNHATNEALFYFSNSFHPTIRNFTFFGVSDKQPLYLQSPKHVPVWLEYSSFPIIENCIFQKCNGHGVFARFLNGGTYTEGLRIDKCGFLNSPYDGSVANQSGIYLGQDAEYSTVTNSYFYNIPSAARFINGANGSFINNIVMHLNGGDATTLNTDRACVYAEPGTNAGKIIIANNHINHNMTAQIPIIIKGDPAKPQNPYKVLNNDLIENGNTSVGYQLVLYDAPNSVIGGNTFRASASGSGHSLVRLNSSHDVMMDDNYFQSGEYAVDTDGNSSFYWGVNYAVGQTQILSPNAKDGITNRNNKALSFRVALDGTASPTLWDNANWTSSKVATGHYEITHDMGTADYTVNAIADDSTVPYQFSVERLADKMTIYTFDATGTPTDARFLLQVIPPDYYEFIL